MANQEKSASNFFDDIVGNGPEKRTIDYRGQKKDVWFRRITGAERISLLEGQVMESSGEGRPSFKIDLAKSAEKNAKLIQFSTVDEFGAQVFDSIGAVKKMPDDLLTLLYKEANDVNKEGDGEPGKS